MREEHILVAGPSYWTASLDRVPHSSGITKREAPVASSPVPPRPVGPYAPWRANVVPLHELFDSGPQNHGVVLEEEHPLKRTERFPERSASKQIVVVVRGVNRLVSNDLQIPAGQVFHVGVNKLTVDGP